MASSLNGNKRFRAARTKRRLLCNPSSGQRSNNARLAVATKSGSDLQLDFDREVVLTGPLTGIVTDIAVNEVSAVQTFPTQIVLTFSGSIAAATIYTIPNPMNAIRTPSGGFAVVTEGIVESEE